MISYYIMHAVTIRTLETKTNPQNKMLFWYLFAGSRGGPARIRIMSHLRNSPRNTNQLSRELGVDYKGILHHLKTLEKNNLVEKVGNNYGVTYFVSSLFEQDQAVFDEIVMKLEKSR